MYTLVYYAFGFDYMLKPIMPSYIYVFISNRLLSAIKLCLLEDQLKPQRGMCLINMVIEWLFQENAYFINYLVVFACIAYSLSLKQNKILKFLHFTMHSNHMVET